MIVPASVRTSSKVIIYYINRALLKLNPYALYVLEFGTVPIYVYSAM